MNKKRAVKTISLFAAVILAVLFLQSFAVMPWLTGDIQTAGFYGEDKGSLDVVLIGASDMYNAFSPVRGYKEFGFTSYPFAPPRNSVGMWQTQVEEVLRTQDPAVIVIEINGALYTEEDILITEDNLRFLTDHMPYSPVKKELIRNNVSRKDRINYYFPYLKYHGNITSPADLADVIYERLCYVKRGGLYMKGERTHFEIYSDEEPRWDTKDDDEQLPMEAAHEAALRAFLDYCRENADCPILFIRTPHYITDENEVTLEFFHRANRVGEVVQDYGYEFINYDKMHEELGLAGDRDFHNPDHLNACGQEKFTDHLGKLLKEKYGAGSRGHSEKVTKEWDRAVRYHDEYLKEGWELYYSGEADGEMLEFYESESQKLLNILEKGMDNGRQ